MTIQNLITVGAVQRRVVHSLVAVVALGAVTGADAADLPVPGPAMLNDVLATAEDGDRLLLAPGEYGVLDFRDRHFASGLTLVSSDPTSPARFTSIYMKDVSGISFDSVVVSFGATNAPLVDRAIELQRVTNFSFVDSEIQSAADGDSQNDAFGAMVRDSSDVTFQHCHFHDVFRGVVFLEATDVAVRDSEFSAIGSDGIAGGGIVGGVFENNYFHDFDLTDPVLYHPDAIQLWDKNMTRANQDIRISGNVILRKNGDATQGIFVRTPGLQTRNIEITDNLIHQSLGQGIYLENANEAVIARNTVTAFNTAIDKPGIDVRDTGEIVAVDDNLATVYRMEGEMASSSNLVLTYDDPWAEGGATALLQAPFEGAGAVSHDFTPLTAVGASGFATGFDTPRQTPPTTVDFPSVIVDLAVAGGALQQGATPVQLDGAPVEIGADAVSEFAVFNGASARNGGQYLFAEEASEATTALNLTFDARLRRPSTAGGWQTIATVAKSWLIRMRGDRLQVIVYDRDGAITRLLASSSGLSDGAWHDLSVRYHGETGRLSIVVDGDEVKAVNTPEGPLARKPTSTLYVGGAPWHETFAGDIASVSIRR